MQSLWPLIVGSWGILEGSWVVYVGLRSLEFRGLRV